MSHRATLSVEERRARRAARREKQREANVGRAAKMRVARMEAASVAKHVPLNRVRVANQQTVYVGCSGWFYWHWRGKLYPANLSTNRWFDQYARRFRTVELNAPFYSWPTLATVESWKRQIGRRKFVYTVKVCELITHVKRFSRTGELVRDFGYIADLLGSRMGCFLFQLPPSFHYTPARLTKILKQLDPRHRNVVEFRHRSWWQEPVYEAFRSAGAIFCSCSGPRLPDELVRTTDDVYIRFHGTERWYRHNYSDAELKAWADRIRAGGARRVWAYFNNDRDGYAVLNATALCRLLEC